MLHRRTPRSKEYWREYRTYFDIEVNWGVDESTIFRIVRKIEKMLLRSGLFNLPGKKILTTKDTRIEVVVAVRNIKWHVD
jgi:hypothetical protein